jgi:hypothetical protein
MFRLWANNGYRMAADGLHPTAEDDLYEEGLRHPPGPHRSASGFLTRTFIDLRVLKSMAQSRGITLARSRTGIAR